MPSSPPTPLVDVLAIFIGGDADAEARFPVDLPAAKTGYDTDVPPDQVTLTVTAVGHLLLNGTAIEEARLGEALAAGPSCSSRPTAHSPTHASSTSWMRAAPRASRASAS